MLPALDARDTLESITEIVYSPFQGEAAFGDNQGRRSRGRSIGRNRLTRLERGRVREPRYSAACCRGRVTAGLFAARRGAQSHYAKDARDRRATPGSLWRILLRDHSRHRSHGAAPWLPHPRVEFARLEG